MNYGTATVFYVDDNQKSRRFLSSVLTECGFKVITAGDPAEALGRCTQISFDLALLDYEMPLLTGTQLALELKFLVPNVPVVLISGIAVLPAPELVFVDAHFGRDTVLDDLIHTMWELVRSTTLSTVNKESSATWSNVT
jgi:CheY-like chemotaxis protein